MSSAGRGQSRSDRAALRGAEDLREHFTPMPDLGTREAVQAMRSGAYDYAAKPLDRRRLLSSLAHAVERRDLVRRVEGLQQQLHEKQGPSSLVGQSVPMRELLRQVERLHGSEVPICLMG